MADGPASGSARVLGERRLPVDRCVEWCMTALETVGVPHAQSGMIADALVDTEARGISSHGIRQLPTYVGRVRRGEQRAETTVATVRDTGTAILLDGGLGFGQIAAARATDLAVERAGDEGIAIVAIRETTHFGALGYFTRMGAQRGRVLLAFQNGPTMVPPFGGRTPLLGTNPFSWAVPVADEDPIVYDVALTAVAGNRVHQLRGRGETSVPEGWMVDARGRPTTDLAKAESGYLQWAAGHKGFGLALLVEMLAGVLADASYGATHHSESPITGRARLAKGGCFVALAPERLLARGEFERRCAELAGQLRSSNPAEGVSEVLLPGDLEQEAYRRAREVGLGLDGPTWESLDSLAERLGIPRL